LVLLKLLGYGRALTLQRGIGKSNGGVGQGGEPRDPSLERGVAGDAQDAAVARLGDLQGDQQTLVLDAPGHVEPHSIVANGRLGGPVDDHAGLGDTVGGKRRPPLARLHAGDRAWRGPRPSPKRGQRHAVTGERLILQPLQPAHGAGVGPQLLARLPGGRQHLVHGGAMRGRVNRAQSSPRTAWRRQPDHLALKLDLGLQGGQLSAGLGGQGARLG